MNRQTPSPSALSRGATVYTQVGCKLVERVNEVRPVMENPILIHGQALKGAAFGDKRLEKRGRHCMKQYASTNR